ncbi:MAG: two-component regulator propeller domain-containing protein, partial [Bacteroidota bacterium]
MRLAPAFFIELRYDETKVSCKAAFGNFCYRAMMVLVLISWIPSLIAQNELIKFDNYSKDDGLFHSQILSICQDKEGLVWIGSYGGLNRFDGTNFAGYSTDNSDIPTNIIYSIVEPKHRGENILWLGTFRGLVKFNKYKRSFYLFDQLPTVILAIEEDENGKLWLATRDQGLMMFDPESGEFTKANHGNIYPSSHPLHSINCILYEQPDIVWLGSDGGGLIQYNCKDHSFEDIAPLNGISCLYNLGSEILIGTIGGGLYAFNKVEESLISIPLYLNGGEKIHQSITHITIDNSGNIWVSSFGGGLYKIKGFNTILKGNPNYEIRNFRVGDDSPSPICSNLINVLYKDYTGNIWIGSEGGGLSKLDFFKHRISHYVIEMPNGKRVRDNNISAVFEDVHGDIWYGVRNNGLYIYHAESNEYRHILLFPANEDDRRNAVHDIYGDRYNRIWVSTDLGIFMFTDRAKPDKYFELNRSDANSMSRNAFITMCLDQRGSLWISDGDHGIYKLDAAEIEKTNHANVITLDYSNIPDDSLINSSIRLWGVMCDSKGNIWISTSDGLYKFNVKEDRFDLHFDKFVNCVFEPERGLGNYLWLGSYGNGVTLLNTADLSSINFNKSMGLCHNNVSGIVEDEQGNIWISTAKGIASIYTKGLYGPEVGDIENESNVRRIHNYWKSDGLQAHEFNIGVAEKLSDDMLVFGGPNGFNRFNPLTIEDNKYVFPVLVTDFKIFNKSILDDTGYCKGDMEYLKKIDLDYKQNYFTVDFNAICYTSPEKAEYQYMLEGFDNEW